MDPSRVIIGVDGNVATGKTTLVRELATRMDAWVLEEYPPHPAERAGAQAGESPSALGVQRHYLRAEARRFGSLRDGPGRSERCLLLDRSVVSQVGHAVAVGESGREVRRMLAHHLAERNSPVLFPDLLVLLSGEEAPLRRRLARRESGAEAMGTAPGYVATAYLRGYDRFLGRLAEALGEQGVVTADACPEIEQVHDKIVGARGTIGPERLRAALMKELRE